MFISSDFHFEKPIEQGKFLESLNQLYDLEIKYGLKLLTKEAHMLRLIKNEPDMYLKHYLIKSGLSIRWFGLVVQTLVDSGLVTKTRCDKDIRGRKLS